ncbi:MAG: hypothetical protein LBC02_13745 [Planctomycetaceae bacterium]|jgi:hypothetical protein|nr:hypothetical protein [Planctomycetaceae bacterium]
MFQRLCLLIFITLFFISGCGVPYRAVTGEVTFNGQPLQEGSITFVPEGKGAGAIGMIKEGRFSIAQKYGVLGGHYSVTILSEQTTAPPKGGDPSMSQTVSLFPAYTFEYTFPENEKKYHIKIEVPSSPKTTPKD